MRTMAVIKLPYSLCHLQMGLLASDQAVSHRSPEVKMASAKLSPHTGVILNPHPPSCVVLSAHTHSTTVDTGKHTESTADQALTPHAELLLMRGISTVSYCC